jgi:hypothetical protein
MNKQMAKIAKLRAVAEAARFDLVQARKSYYGNPNHPATKLAVVKAHKLYEAARLHLDNYKCNPRQRITNSRFNDSTSVGKERLISPMYSSIAKR